MYTCKKDNFKNPRHFLDPHVPSNFNDLKRITFFLYTYVPCSELQSNICTMSWCFLKDFFSRLFFKFQGLDPDPIYFQRSERTDEKLSRFIKLCPKALQQLDCYLSCIRNRKSKITNIRKENGEKGGGKSYEGV